MTDHPHRPSGRARTGVLVAATLWPLIGSTGCGDTEELEPVLRPVRVEAVHTAGRERVRAFSGVSRAGIESQLSFKVGGTIERIDVEVGDEVTVGTVVAKLDDADYRLRLQETEASHRRAEAEARNARSNHERMRGLYESRNASRQELDAARTREESAVAQREALTSSLELARLQLQYTTLEAPVAGAISRVPADVNENVQPGTPIVVLTASGRAEVTVAIPEQLISDVREGDEVSVRLDALGDRLLGARVTEVGVVAQGLATTFPVTVLLDESVADVRPGMAAEVSFTFAATGDGGEHFLVPPHAVGEDHEGRFIFVAEPTAEGRAVVHRREVTVGELTNAGLQIHRGLEDGELLVTAGVSRIEDGLEVLLPVSP